MRTNRRPSLPLACGVSLCPLSQGAVLQAAGRVLRTHRFASLGPTLPSRGDQRSGKHVGPPSEGSRFRRGPVGSIGASLKVRAPHPLGLVLTDQEGLVGDIEDAGVSVKAVQSF